MKFSTSNRVIFNVRNSDKIVVLIDNGAWQNLMKWKIFLLKRCHWTWLEFFDSLQSDYVFAFIFVWFDWALPRFRWNSMRHFSKILCQFCMDKHCMQAKLHEIHTFVRCHKPSSISLMPNCISLILTSNHFLVSLSRIFNWFTQYFFSSLECSIWILLLAVKLLTLYAVRSTSYCSSMNTKINLKSQERQ